MTEAIGSDDELRLGEWLERGPFAVAMSSGFFGFFAHAGFARALTDAGLRPHAVSGSSAGALVAGAIATGMSLDALEYEFFSLTRADFWDPALGPGLLRGRLFRTRLERVFSDVTLEACGTPVHISVHDVFRRAPRVLARGPLVTALHASCAVPGLFHPVSIEGRPHVDGGVSDRPGILGVKAEPRVLYHHLISGSPWRRFHGTALQPPSRAGLIALVIEGLPRSGPFRLEVARHAHAAAREATKRALDRPVRSHEVARDGATVIGGRG